MREFCNANGFSDRVDKVLQPAYFELKTAYSGFGVCRGLKKPIKMRNETAGYTYGYIFDFSATGGVISDWWGFQKYLAKRALTAPTPDTILVQRQEDLKGDLTFGADLYIQALNEFDFNALE